MRTLVLLLLLMLPAGAATLRPFTTVERPVVRLSDLWDGVVKDRDLGPAPAPGGRILVEAPQLAAIARQFDVDWEPASPGDRAVVERAGQPLSRETVLAAVRGALAAAGAPADADVEVSAFVAPIVPTGRGQRSQASASSSTMPAPAQFTALVSVAAEGMAPVQSRVAGRIVPMQETAGSDAGDRRRGPGRQPRICASPASGPEALRARRYARPGRPSGSRRDGRSRRGSRSFSRTWSGPCSCAKARA